MEWSGHFIFSSSGTDIMLLIWKGNWEVKYRALVECLASNFWVLWFFRTFSPKFLACASLKNYEKTNYKIANHLKLWKGFVIGWNNRTSFPTDCFKQCRGSLLYFIYQWLMWFPVFFTKIWSKITSTSKSVSTMCTLVCCGGSWIPDLVSIQRNPLIIGEIL